MKRLRPIYIIVLFILLVSIVSVFINKGKENNETRDVIEVQIQYEKNGENAVSASIKGNYTWDAASDFRNEQAEWNLDDFTKVDVNIENSEKQVFINFSSAPTSCKVIKKNISSIQSGSMEEGEICSSSVEGARVAIVCQKGEAYQVLAQGENWVGKWYFYLQP